MGDGARVEAVADALADADVLVWNEKLKGTETKPIKRNIETREEFDRELKTFGFEP